MPELPEVQTTVNGLRKTVIGLRITDAWSDYNSAYWKGSRSIRDPEYFKEFKRDVLGRKIVSVNRRAKNILIRLDGSKTRPMKEGDIMLVHMKMTGHLLYGIYRFDKKAIQKWQPVSPPSLKDPFNRHIHFLLTFSNGKNLALSDSRKFAKVTLIKAEELENTLHLKDLGPEPLEAHFTFDKFRDRLALRPQGKVKQVLTEQKIIAGIGNIYADESLWRAGIHPLQKIADIAPAKLHALYRAIRETLSWGIDLGGDSMSDYRNVNGEKGKFQEQHYAYRRTGMKCLKKGCGGTIVRISLGGRGTHFCNKHQRLTNKK